jgi:hypothetical protein
MPTVTPIEISVNPRYELNVTNLTGYLIEDLLTPKEFDSLLSCWEQAHVHGIDWDKTIYYFKGKAHATANQRNFYDDYDRKLFDLPENQEWYYQTKDTIYDWSREILGRNIHPRFFQVLEKIKTLPPFNDEPNKWIPIRGLINVLAYEKTLDYHIDGEPAIYNTSVNEINQYSITIYLNSVSDGGEFWIDGDPGFVYRPVPNSAFVFNGGVALHGVSMNLDKDRTTRKAVTFRLIHTDSLLLPGDPDKFLMKTKSLDEIKNK